MTRKLIEYAIPLAEISGASAREKSIRFPSSALHIWWARRPLAVSRTTAFAALINGPGEDHPEEREHLQELIKDIVPWEAVKDGNSDAIEEARRLILAQSHGGPVLGLRGLRHRLAGLPPTPQRCRRHHPRIGFQCTDHCAQ
ncbi:MAG: DUF1156 domain-containing protein [Anaerolineae bacterium]|nr:DUF1156 domain-containing protein [Anaerolineae bacterium]